MDYTNRWQPLRELGSGGQGTVHLAVDLKKLNTEMHVFAPIQAALLKLRQIGSADEHRTAAGRLLDAISRYLDRELPSVSGALKVLNPAARTEKGRARMEREVKALGGQDHPHILRILDSSVADGWLVTQYYPMGALDQHLRRWRGQPVEALEALRPLVEA